MIIVIRKRQIRVLTLFLFLFVGMAVILWTGQKTHISAMANVNTSHDRLFVIDAGHGGEDGGAVATDGTHESVINLQIAQRLNALLLFYGQQTAMIRTEDISIHTPGLATFRERKSSDLQNRVQFVNRQENAVLISIHQNSLPSVPTVHGAQAFYNTQDGSQELAERIQYALNTTVNRNNKKNIRSIPDSIYLMKHSNVPSVLVECGFLSNASETEKLKLRSYQIELSTAMLSGILTEQSALGRGQ